MAFADEIFITKRTDGDKTIFDGKWTFLQEWKTTSEDKINFDQGKYFVMKTGHDYENIYVLIDFVSDKKNDTNIDKAIICFDTKNEKNKIPDSNDFCFWIASGSKHPTTISGNSDFSSVGNWKNIPNHHLLIAVAGVSDQNDRYSTIPHMTYEFKIPIEQIGKNDVYGFYITVYDGSEQKWFSWPVNANSIKYPFIASPSLWGDLISPDKSIPEFGYPILLTIPVFLMIIYLSKKNFSIYKARDFL
ncbi:hypothetical protein NKOR_09855 [Candidatus Nitrosopumilus koreensis AR1]|uniref:Uncharacterized protein n=1 Tax=Candidatus Nitrosopumilus koreensis AR1 TaxID=1229908 RepID=K0BBQ0_9ARCH|nr:hypothetical protein NKOR_09855 [Candidatus Nitrosopumilus koreensis AR1]